MLYSQSFCPQQNILLSVLCLWGITELGEVFTF